MTDNYLNNPLVEIIKGNDNKNSNYGLLDINGNMVLDTIFSQPIGLLSNKFLDNGKANYGYNYLFSSDTQAFLYNAVSNTKSNVTWLSKYHILRFPMVYNKQQFYLYSDNDKKLFGLISDNGQVVLANDFSDLIMISDRFKILELDFLSLSGLKNIFQNDMKYSLSLLNNLDKNNLFNQIFGQYPILQMPKYIYLKKNNKVGVYNLATKQMVIPCKFDSIKCYSAGKLILKNKGEKDLNFLLK